MKRIPEVIILAILLFPCGVFSQSLKKPGDKIQGLASYYGQKFNGRRTASGEKFSVDSLTAAHPNLPFGSLLKVTHLKTGDTVLVKVNDRGPFVHSRILDLSDRAAKIIGLYPYGVSKIEIELIHFGPAKADTVPVTAPFSPKIEIIHIESQIPYLVRPIPEAIQLMDTRMKPDSSPEDGMWWQKK